MKLKKRIKRRLIAIKEFFNNKNSRNALLKYAISYLNEKSANFEINSLSPAEFIKKSPPIKLMHFDLREGNLTYKELIILSTLVKFYEPKNILEIGTFNGVTTLHLAMNSPDDSKIQTLDLVKISPSILSFTLKEDVKYIVDEKKKNKAYHDTSYRSKIVEHEGNSIEYDFKIFGKLDFVFIDGGHSYEVVKSDTEKALKSLKNGGVIVWHDYCPNCEGVYFYLNSLPLDLVHITGTSFVFYEKKRATL
jgi:predicted O-methyltransferase YrrM